MKLSVSISAEDVAVLDDYAAETGLTSRSAAIRHAIRMLRSADLESNYAQAWDEWESSGDQAAWDTTSGDGLARAQG